MTTYPQPAPTPLATVECPVRFAGQEPITGQIVIRPDWTEIHADGHAFVVKGTRQTGNMMQLTNGITGGMAWVPMDIWNNAFAPATPAGDVPMWTDAGGNTQKAEPCCGQLPHMWHRFDTDWHYWVVTCENPTCPRHAIDEAYTRKSVENATLAWNERLTPAVPPSTLFEAMNEPAPEATVSPVVAAVDLPLFASALIREQHEAVAEEASLWIVPGVPTNLTYCDHCRRAVFSGGTDGMKPTTEGKCQRCERDAAGQIPACTVRMLNDAGECVTVCMNHDCTEHPHIEATVAHRSGTPSMPTYDEMYAYLQAQYKHDRFAGRDGDVWGEYSKGVTQYRLDELPCGLPGLISHHDTKSGMTIQYTAQDVINFTRYQVDRSGTNPDSTNVATELIAVLGL